MKRGQTLIELIVAIAILAVVLSVSLRLLFTADRAVGAEAAQLETAGNLTTLLKDLGSDIRAARGIRASGNELRILLPSRVRYYWDERQHGTVRRTQDSSEGDTVYQDVRVRFDDSGKLVRVRIAADDIELQTAFYPRNQ